jgi:hypothetical protein
VQDNLSGVSPSMEAYDLMKKKQLFQGQMQQYAHYTMLVSIWQIGI